VGYHNGQEMNQAVHWQNPSTGANNQDYILYQSGTTRWCDAFHVWGIDWESDHVTWYVDGVATKTITATNEIPAEAMYPILNFDIITNATCSGCGPDSTTPWPGQFQVDYVRVWQH
jgi:beta-glucanase (GH16 family)